MKPKPKSEPSLTPKTNLSLGRDFWVLLRPGPSPLTSPKIWNSAAVAPSSRCPSLRFAQDLDEELEEEESEEENPNVKPEEKGDFEEEDDPEEDPGYDPDED